MPANYYFENFNEFTLFLYIYMAYSDGSLDPTEADLIKQKIKKLFPEVKDIEGKFQQALTNFKSYPGNELEKVITTNFEKHQEKTFTSKYKIFTDLYEIIIADGVVDERENESIEKLKEIIDRNLH